MLVFTDHDIQLLVDDPDAPELEEL